jgi:ABC-type sugar transport system ATPase subunit
MAQVEVRNVSKRFHGEGGRTNALESISFTIREGETISVVGPSGCGKSTLLKIVAGLEFPDAGNIFYNNQDFTNIKPQDRGVGMVFQDYALYPTKAGEGNLKYFFEVHNKSEDEMLKKVKETADIMGVGFELLLGRLPDTLSGGEKQRVAIARCIVRDPELFLMDEPICNLDAKLRERTRLELKKLLKKFAVTTFYITHDQQEAIFMGDRIAVMREGRLEQLGTFDDLYYTPANAFVATFIGAPAMSLLPAVIDKHSITIGETRLELPKDLELPTGHVRLGVRPEGWHLDTAQGLTLNVRHLEGLPTEHASYLHGTVLGKPGASENVTVLAPLDYSKKTTVTITPDWEKVYVFERDKETTLYTPEVLELF